MKKIFTILTILAMLFVMFSVTSCTQANATTGTITVINYGSNGSTVTVGNVYVGYVFGGQAVVVDFFTPQSGAQITATGYNVLTENGNFVTIPSSNSYSGKIDLKLNYNYTVSLEGKDIGYGSNVFIASGIQVGGTNIITIQ